MAGSKDGTTNTAVATWRGGWLCSVDAGGFPLTVDEPPSVGGTGRGPMPTDLLLASLSSCYALALAWAARKRGIELPDLVVARPLDLDDEVCLVVDGPRVRHDRCPDRGIGVVGEERHDHVEVTLRPRVGVAAQHVALHQRRVARGRVAIAAAARCHHLHTIAGAERDVLVLRQMLRDHRRSLAVHAHHVGRAFPALLRARGAEAAMVHDEGGTRLAAPELHLVMHAEAAPLPPGAA